MISARLELNDFCDSADSQSNFHLGGNSTCSGSSLVITIIIIMIMRKIMVNLMMMIMTTTIMIIMMSSGAVFIVLCATQRPIGGRYCPLSGKPPTLHCVTSITGAYPHYNAICSPSGLPDHGGGRGTTVMDLASK